MTWVWMILAYGIGMAKPAFATECADHLNQFENRTRLGLSRELSRELSKDGLILLSNSQRGARPGTYRWILIRDSAGTEWIVGQRIKSTLFNPITQCHTWVEQRAKKVFEQAQYVMGGYFKVEFETGTRNINLIELTDVGGQDLNGLLDPNAARLNGVMTQLGLDNIRLTEDSRIDILWGASRKIRRVNGSVPDWKAKILSLIQTTP